MISSVKDLENLHGRVFSLFRYEYDDRNYGLQEHWTSHADAVNENREFTDDCDGFAFTCVQLLLEGGVPASDVMFIICRTETGEGHAVAGCSLEGRTWILENRYPDIYDWRSEAPGDYTWQFYMRFDQPGQWYQITNE